MLTYRLRRHLAIPALLTCAGCVGYAPEPVDLSAHAAEFAARLPTSGTVRDYVESLRQRTPAAGPLQAADGLSLAEARLLALLFEPSVRMARAHAGVTQAARDESGRWQDPELGADFARILESVQHPWVTSASIGITVPLTGRHGLERELAASQHLESLTAARLAEAHALDALDAAWVQRTTAQQRVELLRTLVDQVRSLEAAAARLSDAGQWTKLAARSFTLERIQREFELQRAQDDALAAELRVLARMGIPPTARLTLLPQLQVESRHPGTSANQVLAEGPRLAAARAAHATAERALELAVDQQWPQLTLLPGQQEEDGQPRAALGFTLPLPLWNRNAKAIAEAQAARTAAAETMRAELERAAQELAAADQRCLATHRQREQVEQQWVPLADQQLAEGQQQAQRGQLDPLLLLDALLRSHTARLQALDAAAAEALAEIERNSLFWPVLATGEVTR